MEDFDNFKQPQFEFSTRRAITEAGGPHRAAFRYDSADNNEEEEEELAMSNEFFDLNNLPDQMPADLFHNKGPNHQTAYLIKPLQKAEEQTSTMRKDTLNSLRPLKPITIGKSNHLPSKVFGTGLNGAPPMAPNSHYNSHKNLRGVTGTGVNQSNTTATNMGNNRYSSQNNRNSEYEDEELMEEQINDEGDFQMADVADEDNCTTQDDNHMSQQFRRGSQRYKDRVHTIRLQSQETYQREHMATSGQNYFTEIQGDRKNEPYKDIQRQKLESTQNEDDEFEIFERAHEQHQYLLSQRSQYNQETNYSQTQNKKYSNAGVQPGTFYHHQNMNRNYQAKRWTTQPNQNQETGEQEKTQEVIEGDKTPQQDMSAQLFDPICGAHFQYKELLKRLSDITSSSQGKNSSTKRKSAKYQQQRKTNETVTVTEGRIPLKEKTQEIQNQPQYQNSNIVKKKNMSILEPKLRPFSNSAKNTKKTEKVAAHTQMNHLLNTNQVAHQKLTKLLLTNQENNFIDKKLKDLQNELQIASSNNKNNISKNISTHQNKTVTNLHKTNEKTLTKLSGIQQQNCQINNMKLKSQSSINAQSSCSQTSQSKQAQASILNIHAAAKAQNSSQKGLNHPNLQTVSSISNIFTNTIVSSSISSGNNNNMNPQTQPSVHTSSTSALLNATKSASTNFLRSATTTFTTATTTKSSAVLTQSNSNKQIISKETPEGTARQKVRLNTGGTAFSSTSKRNNNYTGGLATMSINSQGNLGSGTMNLMQNSSKALQQIIYQQPDSGRKSQHSSDDKKQHSSRNHMSNSSQNNNQHPSSAPRSNSSHKKVQVQKMMIKNPSFTKNLLQDNQAIASKKQMNDFYNAIFKKISNTNFTAVANNAYQQQHQQAKMNQQMRISEKSYTNANGGLSSKTTRVSGKVSRLSKGGSNTATSVNSNSKSKQRSNEKGQVQQSPRSESHSKSRTRKNSSNVQRESIYGADSTSKNMQKTQIHINNSATSSQVQLQKVNQLLKKFHDQNQIPQQVLPQKQGMQGFTQPSILMNHQVKKQQSNLISSRPLSGNNIQQNINHFLADHNSFNRKNSIDKVQQQLQQTQIASNSDYLNSQRPDQQDCTQTDFKNTQIQDKTLNNQSQIGIDNRQSLMVQHRTMEKKPNVANQNATVGQINLKHQEKMSKYLMQKKEELVQATQKNQATKKGFLLANIKIQKNSRLQQMTQETYERLHLPTEEDDLKNNNGEMETFQIGNLITNLKDDMYNVYSDTQTQPSYQQQVPSLQQTALQGGRLSVKVKAKNF